MKFVKVILIVLAVLAVIAGGIWQFALKDVVAEGRIGVAFAAKQACSCRFISERSLESCKGDFLADMSQVSFSEGENHISTSAMGGFLKSEARYTPGLGCSFTD